MRPSDLITLPSGLHWFFGGRRRPPTGAPPGAVMPDSEALAPKIYAFSYTTDSLTEQPVATLEELEQLARENQGVLWIDIQGLGNADLIMRIGEILALHPLAVADTVNANQRSKIESYEDHLFMVGRMIRPAADEGEVVSEQLSLFLSDRLVVTFQETYGDNLDPVRARIRNPKSMMRKSGADFLAYAILDTVIDGVYPVLDIMEDALEALEEHIIEDPVPGDLERSYQYKRKLLGLRRVLRPQREAMSMLYREESPYLSHEIRVYLRDVYDHSVHLLDAVETYNEFASGLMELYLSHVSNRMNEVMKVLTIIATIFIPLTFLAGVYGMNFHYMPELQWRWAYPALWILMVGIALGLLYYFRRKGWIGGEGRRRRAEGETEKWEGKS